MCAWDCTAHVLKPVSSTNSLSTSMYIIKLRYLPFVYVLSKVIVVPGKVEAVASPLSTYSPIKSIDLMVVSLYATRESILLFGIQLLSFRKYARSVLSSNEITFSKSPVNSTSSRSPSIRCPRKLSKYSCATVSSFASFCDNILIVMYCISLKSYCTAYNADTKSYSQVVHSPAFSVYVISSVSIFCFPFFVLDLNLHLISTSSSDAL